jgi:Domain of unknown function (DUF4291)
MKLETIPYTNYELGLPQNGQHILGQLRGENIIVYQAFNPAIANYAVQHQKFGGPAYSFSRMSWIKPNFLWMMYRAGWAMKEHQQRILAIEIPLTHFETILEQAAYSSFQPDVYADKAAWETALQTSEVRLQWDPDHNPSGAKLQRRAVQLGMKGYILKQFCTEWIMSIEDITPFVLEQGHFVAQNNWANLLVMKEIIIPIRNKATIQKFKIDNV